MRLNDIAQVRAVSTAPTMRRNNRQPGQPRVSRAATVIEASANGSAKTVCESLTNSPHLTTSEIIQAPASEAKAYSRFRDDQGPARRQYRRLPGSWSDENRKQGSRVESPRQRAAVTPYSGF